MHAATKFVLFTGFGLSAAWLATQPEPRAAARRAQRPPRILDMDGPALVRGRVQLDAEIPANFLRARLTYSGPEGQRSRVRALELDGGFEFQAPLSGDARLEVLAPEGGEPLLCVPDLQLGGERDARLFELDLSGELLVTEVELICQDGSWPVRGQVAWRPSGSERFSQFVLPSDGLARIVSRAEMLDIYVQAAGQTSEYVGEVSGATRVILRDAVELTLQLSPEVPELVRSGQLLARLVRPGPAPHLEDAASPIQDFQSEQPMIPIDADGRARLQVPSSGAWEVHWRLYDERGASLASAKQLPPIRIEVPGGYVPRLIPLDLSPDTIRAALAGDRR